MRSVNNPSDSRLEKSMKSKQTSSRIQWKSRLKALKTLTNYNNKNSSRNHFSDLSFSFVLTVSLVYHPFSFFFDLCTFEFISKTKFLHIIILKITYSIFWMKDCQIDGFLYKFSLKCPPTQYFQLLAPLRKILRCILNDKKRDLA